MKTVIGKGDSNKKRRNKTQGDNSPVFPRVLYDRPCHIGRQGEQKQGQGKGQCWVPEELDNKTRNQGRQASNLEKGPKKICPVENEQLLLLAVCQCEGVHVLILSKPIPENQISYLFPAAIVGNETILLQSGTCSLD